MLSRLSTLLGGQLLVTVALFAVYSGILSVLLPRQVAALDPTGKVAALAAVTSISFAVTALAQPLFGALSDRTRTRWGRRVPWMLGCAVVGGGIVALLPAASTVAWVAVLWAAGQFVLNGTDIALSAYLVDRFPAQRRGGVAGALGVAVVVGGGLGVVVAGALGTPWGHWVLAGALVGVVLVFAVVVRDPPAPKPIAVAVAAPARLTPDLLWVLLSKLLFTLGYASVYGYLLYIVVDHVGLPEEQAVGVVGMATVVGGVGLVIAVLGGGLLSDRMGRRKLFVAGAGAAVAIGDAVLLTAPGPVGLLVAAFLLGAGLGLSISAGTALASLVIPGSERNAGAGLGTLNLVGNVGQAVAPLITAAVVAATGGYSWVFAVSAGLALASGGVVILVRAVR
jgi:MFS family permease